MYSIGIKFLNKLSFTRKFQIILFTLFLPILYASVIIYKENSNRIELISNKIIGIETVNKLKPLRILAAKHRGNSAQWFSGNTQLNTTIRSLEQDMVKAFDVVQIEINSPFYSDNSRQAFNQLKKV